MKQRKRTAKHELKLNNKQKRSKLEIVDVLRFESRLRFVKSQFELTTDYTN
jgi:hypothetical protein